MRFAHLRTTPKGPAYLAVIIEDTALFLDTLLPVAPRDLQELIEQGEYRLDSIRSLVHEAVHDGAALIPLNELWYSSPVLRPPQVLAIGANYAAHASELRLPSEASPTVFSLWPNSLTGHEATITWSESITSQVDYEVELGVIVGKAARNVESCEALGYVWGYTVVNDITARDLQFSEAQWSRSKSFDGFTPTGPVVVTVDEVPNPQDLALSTSVDGVLLQSATTADMVRSVSEIIAFLSRTATIQPGTLISTGSPGGAGYSRTPPVFLKDGSTVTVAIEGIGELTTHCSPR